MHLTMYIRTKHFILYMDQNIGLRPFSTICTVYHYLLYFSINSFMWSTFNYSIVVHYTLCTVYRTWKREEWFNFGKSNTFLLPWMSHMKKILNNYPQKNTFLNISHFHIWELLTHMGPYSEDQRIRRTVQKINCWYFVSWYRNWAIKKCKHFQMSIRMSILEFQ